jgi:hypothetical protein
MYTMSKLEQISQEMLITLEGIVKLISAGHTVAQVAQRTNLDVPTVDGLMGRDEFHAVFKELDEKGYQRWMDDQADLTAKRAVKNMARADAVEFYKLARDLVRSGDDLKTNERLNHLFNLMRISGLMDKEVEEERVTLSEGTLESLADTMRELGEFFHGDK